MRRGSRGDKRLNQPDERRPVAEMAGFAGEDVDEGAAEFGTAVANILQLYSHSEQMRSCPYFFYGLHLFSANTAKEWLPILKYNGRIVPKSFSGVSK